MSMMVKIILATVVGIIAAVVVSVVASYFLWGSVYGDTVDPCQEALELSQTLVEEYGYETQYVTNAALHEDGDAAAVNESDIPEMLESYYDAVEDCESVS